MVAQMVQQDFNGDSQFDLLNVLAFGLHRIVIGLLFGFSTSSIYVIWAGLVAGRWKVGPMAAY